MRQTRSLLATLEEVFRKSLTVVVVMAAIGAGVLLVGASSSKVEASPPTSGKVIHKAEH
jgi:hypothetical protein